jgi:hypothetical protein
MTAAVMIILAAVAAAWVLAPLRNATAPASSPERPPIDDKTDRERAGGHPLGGTMERTSGGVR